MANKCHFLVSKVMNKILLLNIKKNKMPMSHKFRAIKYQMKQNKKFKMMKKKKNRFKMIQIKNYENKKFQI